MNERIRELAEQQGLTGPNFLISSYELEKFAELIVKECIDIAYREGDDVAYLAFHFGVEE